MKSDLQQLQGKWAGASTFLLFGVLIATSGWAQEAAIRTGIAIEVRNAGNYTYLQIQEGDEEYWIATPHTRVPKGAKLSFSEQVWMYDFRSKVLNRTFDKVLFVGTVRIETAPADGEAIPPPTGNSHPPGPQPSPADAPGTSDLGVTPIDQITPGNGLRAAIVSTTSATDSWTT